ncbi:MAG: hypothetical protein WD738_10650 [Pirellulales bacterium]
MRQPLQLYHETRGQIAAPLLCSMRKAAHHDQLAALRGAAIRLVRIIGILPSGRWWSAGRTSRITAGRDAPRCASRQT